MAKPNFVAVTTVESMGDKNFACFSVEGTDIVIGRFRDEFFAVENLCSHAQSHFDSGRLRGYNLICPLHSGSFDIRDGSPTGLPARKPIRSFPVRVVDGTLEVQIQ